MPLIKKTILQKKKKKRRGNEKPLLAPSSIQSFFFPSESNEFILNMFIDWCVPKQNTPLEANICELVNPLWEVIASRMPRVVRTIAFKQGDRKLFWENWSLLIYFHRQKKLFNTTLLVRLHSCGKCVRKGTSCVRRVSDTGQSGTSQ